MADRTKVTLPTLFKKAAEEKPITWLTCYDYPTALLSGGGRDRHDPRRGQPRHDHVGL